MAQTRQCRYVGPAELRGGVASVGAIAVDNLALLDAWLVRRGRDELAEPFTFVIAPGGRLRLAPRRSEHVALAAGQHVLAAGEITFAYVRNGWRVIKVTNQSTGYCPDPDCWPVVAEVLDRLRVPHPGDFTDKVIFRRCPIRGERNVVREGNFTCALCDHDLPMQWNITSD